MYALIFKQPQTYSSIESNLLKRKSSINVIVSRNNSTTELLF